MTWIIGHFSFFLTDKLHWQEIYNTCSCPCIETECYTSSAHEGATHNSVFVHLRCTWWAIHEPESVKLFRPHCSLPQYLRNILQVWRFYWGGSQYRPCNIWIIWRASRYIKEKEIKLVWTYYSCSRRKDNFPGNSDWSKKAGLAENGMEIQRVDSPELCRVPKSSRGHSEIGRIAIMLLKIPLRPARLHWMRVGRISYCLSGTLCRLQIDG